MQTNANESPGTHSRSEGKQRGGGCGGGGGGGGEVSSGSPGTNGHSPRSWPMADWFMDECIMLSDCTLGGRGGIWLPAGRRQERGDPTRNL